MPKGKKFPMRQCIACRQLKEKRDMLRIVKGADGDIFIDFSGKANGRGAYVCDNPECVAKLKKARLLEKTFSCAVSAEIYSAVEEEYLGKKD